MRLLGCLAAVVAAHAPSVSVTHSCTAYSSALRAKRTPDDGHMIELTYDKLVTGTFG